MKLCVIRKLMIPILCFVLSGIIIFAGAQTQQSEDLVIGKKINLHSIFLDEDREILIYLPTDYFKTEKHYPVLYMLQGSEILFHKASGTIRYLSEFKENIPEMILVNILFTDYLRDIFPVELPDIPAAGGADKFLDFLCLELIPYMDKNYRTFPFNILYGQSNTGMLAIYTLLTNPDYFKSYIASSPAIGQGDNFMYPVTDTSLVKYSSLDKLLFITMGSDDPLADLVNEVMPGYLEILAEKAPEDLKWSIREYEGGGHCPQVTLHDGLEITFVDWPVPESVKNEGISDIKEYLQKLNIKYGSSPNSKAIYWEIGMEYMRKEEYLEALPFFKETIEIDDKDPRSLYQIGKISALTGENTENAIECLKTYLALENEYLNPPKSAAHWRLGMIYERTGRIEIAKEEYRVAIKLDPFNKQY
ncbi:MAG: tetratricopeptide repeat protein, partial [Bacteroidales bacterium]